MSQLHVAQQSFEQSAGVPQDRQASPPPVVLAVAVAAAIASSSRGTALACMQPALQLAQDLIYAACERDKLLIFGSVVGGFHSEIDYTQAVGLDVSEPADHIAALD